MKKFLCLLCLNASVLVASAQTVWYNPMKTQKSVLQGQGWPDELSGTYNRFPERIKANVRPALWALSTHAAGLALEFQTDATVITVRYGVSGAVAMSHMPATGVSGVDLYAVDQRGGYHFLNREFDDSDRDTVCYTFHPISTGQSGYRLYLPLYNHVDWLEVGVDSSALFQWLPRRDELPVVAYGTSILQGGCASRPAMAWTNILSRALGCQVMNYGFSGNGQMDPQVLELLAEIPARMYLIDCVPNLSYTDDSLFVARYREGIALLRKASDVPILLVEHAGGMPSFANAAAESKNRLLRQCYDELRAQGVRELYYLSCDEVCLPADGTVDGIHPTDLGMVAIAKAYQTKIRKILHLPAVKHR